jgi:membrane associated rhomboid family serine protease
VFAFGDVERATVGASGAVYGLLGGILIAAMRLRLNITPIVLIIAVNLWISIQIPQISLLGHVGGLVAGLLITAAMVYAPERRRTPLQTGAAVGVAVVLLALVLVRYVQFGEVWCSEDGSQCGWTGSVSSSEPG